MPPRMHWKHGRYWYVHRNKWESLSTSYSEALTGWSVRMNPGSGMTGLVDRVMIALEKRGGLAANTLRQYSQAAAVIKHAFADFAPDQVRQTDVARFHDFHIETPNMANRYLTLLRIIFDYAIRWGEAPNNPAVGIRRHKEHTRTRYLTDGEYQAIRTHASPWLALCMDLLYLTAQRISDVLAIRMTDISLEGIRFEQEKTGSRVMLAMTPELQDVITQARKLRGLMLSPYLFHPRSKATHYAYGAARCAFERACARAGVTDAMTRRYLRLRQTVVVEGPRMKKA